MLKLEPSVLTQDLVQRDGPIDGGDGVFRDDDDIHAACFEEIGQVPDEFIDVTTSGITARVRRAKALQVVIEVREVDEVEIRLLMLLNPAGRGGNPLRGRQASARAPKTMEREIAKVALEQLAGALRVAGDVEDFSAVGLIDRTRGHGDVRIRPHVIPPKEVRDLELRVLGVEFVPNFRGANHAVGLLPELHFTERAVIPTVTDDAVHGRRLAGEVIRLRRAGDSGERGADFRDGALRGAGGQAWHHT